MTRHEHLLIILAEECNEVAHRISKALRFGLDDIQPGQQMDNGERISLELDDVFAVLQMLCDDGFVYHSRYSRIQAKKDRVEKYLEFSRNCGTLA